MYSFIVNANMYHAMERAQARSKSGRVGLDKYSYEQWQVQDSGGEKRSPQDHQSPKGPGRLDGIPVPSFDVYLEIALEYFRVGMRHTS